MLYYNGIDYKFNMDINLKKWCKCNFALYVLIIYVYIDNVNKGVLEN